MPTIREFSKIAILLASYNGERFLSDQVRSLLTQNCSDVHLFVRDDGSVDGTFALIEQLRSAHPEHIDVVKSDTKTTGSAAKNFFALLNAVDCTNYEYIAFSDQDDIWLPGKLKRAVECIGARGGGGYSSNLLAWEEESDATWIVDKAGEPKSLDYLFQGASAGCTYVLDRASAMLVQQHLQKLTAPYCDGVSHDWVVYAICRSAGVRWFHDSEYHIRYRQHGSNVYGALPGVRGVIARMRMMRAGWYKNHILWLDNVINNNAEERAVLAAINRGSLADRLKLIRMAKQFRRKPNDVWKLRAAIALGLLQ